MKENRYCVIMAGGIGARFWPMSRRSCPKQFLDILGTGKSFIRHTYDRFANIVPKENFIVVTNKRYRELVMEHIPELDSAQILCEPIGRNTAPCIAYAAYTLRKSNPDAEMIVTPADHLILNELEFANVVERTLEFIRDKRVLMTIGVNPTRPETGYGYIQRSSSEQISKVKCFTEKPSREIAEAFLECGEFLWNSGIFVWRVSDIIDAIRLHLPDHAALFEAAEPMLGTDSEERVMEQVFSECKPISVDYGIMERADNVYVHTGDFGWSDVGTWSSVYAYQRKDKYANALSGDMIHLYDTRNSLIAMPKGKVAAISGLRDFIVVDTEDVLMICPRSEEQSIKGFIEDVRFATGEDFV